MDFLEYIYFFYQHNKTTFRNLHRLDAEIYSHVETKTK